VSDTDFIGQFELYVLAALARLGDEAYGVTIRADIESRSGRPTSHGAVYTTVERLADKGYVTFWVSEAQPVQGGRRRKHVRLTAAGRRALRSSAHALDRMLEGLALGLSTVGQPR
jgi:PadR family transcriptional regulator PadR